jgi:hypothetical protein
MPERLQIDVSLHTWIGLRGDDVGLKNFLQHYLRVHYHLAYDAVYSTVS